MPCPSQPMTGDGYLLQVPRKAERFPPVPAPLTFLRLKRVSVCNFGQ